MKNFVNKNNNQFENIMNDFTLDPYNSHNKSKILSAVTSINKISDEMIKLNDLHDAMTNNNVNLLKSSIQNLSKDGVVNDCDRPVFKDEIDDHINYFYTNLDLGNRNLVISNMDKLDLANNRVSELLKHTLFDIEWVTHNKFSSLLNQYKNTFSNNDKYRLKLWEDIKYDINKHKDEYTHNNISIDKEKMLEKKLNEYKKITHALLVCANVIKVDQIDGYNSTKTLYNEISKINMTHPENLDWAINEGSEYNLNLNKNNNNVILTAPIEHTSEEQHLQNKYDKDISELVFNSVSNVLSNMVEIGVNVGHLMQNLPVLYQKIQNKSDEIKIKKVHEINDKIKEISGLTQKVVEETTKLENDPVCNLPFEHFSNDLDEKKNIYKNKVKKINNIIDNSSIHSFRWFVNIITLLNI